MGWIKRNLFFTIGGAIALALLGAACYYNFTSWRANHDSFAKVQEAYQSLQNYYNQNPTPSENNIVTARRQEKQLRDWIAQARKHFVPVPPIPNPPDGNVTATAFSENLRRTIHDMQVAAVEANVEVPDDYSFSFAAERNQLTFAPASLNALASHLGEVKAICDVLFAAKINGIDSIQREVVSDSDTAGAQADFLTEKTRTESLASITPYAITIRCFSGDLGNVLSKFASSDYSFIVTGINVMPAAGGLNAPGGANPPPPQNQPAVQNGALQTVLDEQLLRVSLGIEVVKLTK